MVEYVDDFVNVPYFRVPYISNPFWFRRTLQEVVDTLWHILSQLYPNYLEDLPPQRFLELYDLYKLLKTNLENYERDEQTSGDSKD